MKTYIFRVFISFVMVVQFLVSAASVTLASEELSRVSGPCGLRFPDDHGPHENFRTEWWYYTGNVTDSEGSAFGFQLTFFRYHIKPPALGDRLKEVSAWRTSQLILAHAALTDIKEEKHFQAEKMARQALSIAGTFQKGQQTQVFVKNWRLKMLPEYHLLKAAAKDFSLEFTLTPLKDPVLHGDRGYSRKGRKMESASCYYSFTRLKAEGIITAEGRRFDVEGFAWMDHEFSTNPLEPDLAGWDWFSIQLDDQTELMAYFLRHHDGTFSDVSSGTFVSQNGKSVHLNRQEMVLEILDTWKSGRSPGEYPSRWRLEIPRMNLSLDIRPALPDQEMHTEQTTGVVYWEGSIAARGFKDGVKISGAGYVELTGYAEPFKAPM